MYRSKKLDDSGQERSNITSDLSSPLDAHLRRERLQEMLRQRAGPYRGGVFRAGNIYEADWFHKVLQKSQPQQQSSFSRNQEWAFNQHMQARINTSIKDQCSGNGLVHELMLNKEGNPSFSHLFDLRDVIAANNELSRKPQRFQEERWQVGGNSSFRHQHFISSSLCNSNFGKRVINCSINDQLSSLNHHSSAFNTGYDSFKFQSPVLDTAESAMLEAQEREENPRGAKKMRLIDENEIAKPDLHLSLSSTSSMESRLTGLDSTELSLSLAQKTAPAAENLDKIAPKMRGEISNREIDFFSLSSSKKSSLRMTTLDLTMSIS